MGPASKRVKVTREYSVVLKEKKNKEKVQFSFNIFFKFRRIQCSISEVLKNNNNIKKCATTPKVKKPACFSSGSFNFRLLFFSSAELLTPSPLRKFVSDKKSSCWLSSLWKFLFGEEIVVLPASFCCYRCPFADYCFFGVDPAKHFEEWHKHFSEIER